MNQAAHANDGHVEGTSDRHLSPSTMILAPLLPIALAMGLGVLLDRTGEWPLMVYGGLCLVGLLVLAFRKRNPDQSLPASNCDQSKTIAWGQLCALMMFIAGLMAAWHRWSRQPAGNDVMHAATGSGQLVRMRGWISSELVANTPDHTEWRSQGLEMRTVFTLQAQALDQSTHWLPVSGLVRVGVGGLLPNLQVGQQIELIGLLRQMAQPLNPGSEYQAQYWRDRGIGSVMHVKNADGITLLADDESWSLTHGLSQLRCWIRKEIDRAYAPEISGLVKALLLGDQQAVPDEQSDGFRQTGVYHVLAVSGLHLVVLAGFVSLFFRVSSWQRRARWLGLTFFVILYALLTGAEPPVMRAAILVIALLSGRAWYRVPEPLNALALAWIVIGIWQPSDLARTGTQLSFLAVLLLYVFVTPQVQAWQRVPTDPLQRLIRDAEPWHHTLFRKLKTWLGLSFFSSLVLWIGTLPLILARFHLLSPIAIILGPPVILCTSLGLMANFAWLLLVLLNFPGTDGIASVAGFSLQASAKLVTWANDLTMGHWYVADVSELWLMLGYLGVLSVLIFYALHGKEQPRLGLIAVMGIWLLMGWLLAGPKATPGELRCTVLAVGHGQCAVVETAEGRVLLFDAGSLSGPELATHVIAPFLWSRGITRIDEILCSHADLDHYNAIPQLIDRFQIGQVSFNPSFAKRMQGSSPLLLSQLKQRGISIRTLSNGDRLQSGSLFVDVLHPPAEGPSGTENARSLVLSLTCQGRTLLFTGDLQEPGLSMVLRQPRRSVDILIAPHHGSPSSNTPDLAQWANPKLVISSEGRLPRRQADPYTLRGAMYWRTANEGAVIVIGNPEGLHAKTHWTAKQWSLESHDAKTVP